MARINPTWPNSGDHGWATQMNGSLNQLLALLNSHDDILAFANGYVDGGTSTSSDAPLLDGGNAGVVAPTGGTSNLVGTAVVGSATL